MAEELDYFSKMRSSRWKRKLLAKRELRTKLAALTLTPIPDSLVICFIADSSPVLRAPAATPDATATEGPWL